MRRNIRQKQREFVKLVRLAPNLVRPVPTTITREESHDLGKRLGHEPSDAKTGT